MIKSITKTLLKPTEKLEIKLSVNLISKTQPDRNYYSIFERDGLGYMKVDITSSVVIDIKDKEGGWSRDKRLHLNYKNMYQFISGLKKFNDIMNNGDFFTYNKNGTIDLTFEKDKDEVFMSNLQFNQFVKLTPAIIHDCDDRPLAGMYMFINNTANIVDLSMDEFESILYLMDNLNISIESQALLNMYVLEQLKLGVGNTNRDVSKKIEENKNELKEELMKTGAANIFDLALMNKEQETVTGGVLLNKQPQSLDDLFVKK